MNSSNPYDRSPNPGGHTGLLPSVSAFSTYHNFLRNCNYLIGYSGVPNGNGELSENELSDEKAKKNNCGLLKCSQEIQENQNLTSPPLRLLDGAPILERPLISQSSSPTYIPSSLLDYSSVSSISNNFRMLPLDLHPRARSPSSFFTSPKRHRSEKKAIPSEQKDDKYFERRRRNNQAAKKSRDARKMREDQIALRATLLEHENAVLRAQLLTLRDEATSLRQMLLQKKAFELVTRDNRKYDR